MWVTHFTRSFVAAILLYLAMVQVLGREDYFSKFIVHLANMIVFAMTFGLIMPSIGINNSIGFEPEPMSQYIPLVILSVLIYIGSFYAIMSLTDPYLNPIRELNANLEKRKFKAEFSEEILKDSFFGPIYHLLQEMLRGMELLISEASKVVNTIEVSSESLAKETQEIASIIEEVASTSDSASQAANTQAIQISELLEEVMQSSSRIGKVVEDISLATDAVREVSIQTSIIALNAAVEASKAGEAGKGFAVVADDIRRLSEESRKSVDTISEISSNIMKELDSLFVRIQEKVENVATISEETAASSEEISASAHEIKTTIERIAQDTRKLSDETERLNTAMKSLLLQSMD
ncbi:MAG: hypothetical protein D6732_23915 [Methanobacteriota archaeon]|nr:MAG: hypothetical protein D6732_23915 [Euryarchaeota archaeon]